MNEITLATLLEEKFRTEILPDTDKRKYIENDWLINEILQLLKKHPELKNSISIDEMSVGKILERIEIYFNKMNQKRRLNKVPTINFLKKHPEFRKVETLILLMVLGMSFIGMFKRMSNNQKKVGDVLDIETSFEGVTCNVNYNGVMPKQVITENAKELYELISNVCVPDDVIQSSIEEFNNNEEIKMVLKKGSPSKQIDKKPK